MAAMCVKRASLCVLSVLFRLIAVSNLKPLEKDLKKI
jgi:hypothetical protein